MAAKDRLFDRIKKICLCLPDTTLEYPWDTPHFKVCGKIFAGCGDQDGAMAMSFKLAMEHANRRVKDPRFWRAPYVGRSGWVSIHVSTIKDWDDLRGMLLESYSLVAPRKSLARLEGAEPATRRASAKKRTSAPRKKAKHATTRKTGQRKK